MSAASRAVRMVCLLVAAILAAFAQSKQTAPAKPTAPPKLDINSAWQVQLEKLPGITRPLAKKIVANRPYVALEDLKRVGIPAETIEKIRPLVVVEQSVPSNHPMRPTLPKAKSGKP